MGHFPWLKYTGYINPLGMCAPSFNSVSLAVFEKNDRLIFRKSNGYTCMYVYVQLKERNMKFTVLLKDTVYAPFCLLFFGGEVTLGCVASKLWCVSVFCSIFIHMYCRFFQPGRLNRYGICLYRPVLRATSVLVGHYWANFFVSGRNCWHSSM